MLHGASVLELYARQEDMRLLCANASSFCLAEVGPHHFELRLDVGLTHDRRSLDRHEVFIENVKKAWAQHVPHITLEQALLDIERKSQGMQSADTASPTSSGSAWAVHSEPETSHVAEHGNAEYTNAEDFEFDESDDFNEAIDGMGFLTVGPRKSGYTGPQSGLAAVKFLRSLPSEGQAGYEDTVPGESPGDSIDSMEPALNMVNIDEVINDYFTLFHTAYPLLHEGLFRARMAGTLMDAWYA